MLSALHHDCLRDLLGERLLVEELDSVPANGARAAGERLLGFIDGVTPKVAARVVERARREGVTHLYLDGSNLGRLARAVRKALPDIRVISFFHNVEARFFLGAFRETGRARALGVLVANYLAERMATRHSHRVVTLSERDSRGLERLYGRGATDLLPMAMEDKLMRDEALPQAARRAAGAGPYLLFVGGSFYANEAGIRWFVEHLAAGAGLKTCVVGRGLESLRPQLEREGSVEVIGGVERLQDWYLEAAAVIAPIFDGSGMKTKVAEALMYGKRIIGTPEAFSGYENVAGAAGWVCTTKEDFAAALRQVREAPPPRFDPALRALYEQHYSRDAAHRRLAEILAIPAPGR
jgi:hypothetical protein